MAVLTNQDRFDVWADWMRQQYGSVSITKVQLRAAVDALDNFFEANAAAINNALPAEAQAGLTTPQKAALSMAVVAKRYVAGA